MRWYINFIKFLMGNKANLYVTYSDDEGWEKTENVPVLRRRIFGVFLVGLPCLLLAAAVSLFVIQYQVDTYKERAVSSEETVSLLQEKINSFEYLEHELAAKKSVSLKPSAKINEAINEDLKPIQVSSKNTVDQFLIKDSSLVLKNQFVSPYQVEIEHAKIFNASPKKFFVRYKLNNLSSAMQEGNVSAYISYVDSEDRFKKLYYPKDSKRVGRLISGKGKRFKFKKFKTGNLFFDFDGVDVKSIKSIYINVKSKDCGGLKSAEGSCPMLEVNRMVSAYIEPQIEINKKISLDTFSKLFK